MFCTRPDGEAVVRFDLDPWYEVADRDDLSYDEKLRAYRRLADAYFTTDRYHDFCASRLAHLDEVVFDWVSSGDFDKLLVDTVQATYPAHEQDQFVAHFRGCWSCGRRPDSENVTDPLSEEELRRLFP